MTARFVVGWVVVAIAGCGYPQPSPFSGDGGGGSDGASAHDSPPGTCACTDPDKLACNTSTETCVQCTTIEPSACSGVMPTCGSDDACRACVTHSDCATDACLPTGACGTDTDTAYVSATGSGVQCTKDAPCLTLAAGLATNLPYIKMAGAIKESATTTIAQTVTLLADPATSLVNTGGGTILSVSTGHVQIFDLELMNATTIPGGPTGDGIDLVNGDTPTVTLTRVTIDHNAGFGVRASSGTVTVAQSVIAANTNGGLSLSATAATLVNNVIAGNGTSTGVTGGISINASGQTCSVQFNTIANNQTTATAGSSGINCNSGLAISDNIITGNTASASCTSTYSLFDSTIVVTGTNRASTPTFASTDLTHPESPTFYRIMAGSPAIDAADPGSTNPIDIDGQSRPQGAGYDIGADEYKP